MKINNVGSTNFGATPCKITKEVLAGLEHKGIDTTTIIKKMLGIFPNDSFRTHRFSDGTLRMDIYSSTVSGDVKSVITTGSKLHTDPNFMPLEPESLYAKLDSRLDILAENRSLKQKIADKVERLCKG